jgi:uncharacterized protein (DUF342 family)
MPKLPKEKVPKVEIANQIQGDGWKLVLLVSTDRLTASVQIFRTSPKAVCLPEKVVDLVRGSGLRLSPAEETRLPELAKTLTSAGMTSTVVVAKGSAAGKWRDIDWLIPIGISSLLDYSDETIDLHEVSHFINARAGQALCEIPAIPKTGRNVYGEPIQPEMCPLQLGDRVALDPKNTSRVIATEPGCVRYASGRLSIEQHLEILGDLNFKVGNIDFCGEVTIRGSVWDGFHVKSAKNVTIEGGVGTATIEAVGNITIKGGVNGGHKGRLICGGNLQSHYLHMVSVECGGDVQVDVECHDSSVLAAGSVTVSRGGIIGGRVQAGNNVSAGSIGTEMCVPTTVCAGHDPGMDSQVEKARKSLASARALARNLESAVSSFLEKPGMAVRLPSQRKTQTTQLQVRLTDARSAVKRARAELAAQAHGMPVAGATITSAKQVFPKVTLVIDSLCEEEIASEIPGPVGLRADPDQMAIAVVSGKGRGGTLASR